METLGETSVILERGWRLVTVKQKPTVVGNGTTVGTRCPFKKSSVGSIQEVERTKLPTAIEKDCNLAGRQALKVR